jgi:hypothetical protein
MRKLLLLIILPLLLSCSLPFGLGKGKSDPAAAKKEATAAKTDKGKPAKTDKGERVEEAAEPKPGDVKVVDGVEYIYTRNRRFQLTPHEPEYVWLRKDQYSPGIFESLTEGGKKERQELEKRMAKLEEELKKKGLTPQVVYPQQVGVLPGAAYMASMPVGFAYPSPKMRRRVIVLPVADKTNYKDEHLNELTTKRLVSRLENTGTIICVDPNTLNISSDLTSAQAMKTLNESYGVQAVLRGTLSDIYTSTSKPDGRDDREVSFALSKIALDILNTETGKTLRQLTARNPFFLSRERGDMSTEKAKVKAIDLAIELLAEDLLRTLLTLDWHARIASIDGERVFINAGSLSGLKKGDTLEVYAPGAQIIDQGTKQPLGRIKGTYKGELEVVELFGVDASWAKVKKPAAFSPTDLVYLKQ